jgi:hypothetical protein
MVNPQTPATTAGLPAKPTAKRTSAERPQNLQPCRSQHHLTDRHQHKQQPIQDNTSLQSHNMQDSRTAVSSKSSSQATNAWLMESTSRCELPTISLCPHSNLISHKRISFVSCLAAYQKPAEHPRHFMAVNATECLG